MSEPGYLVRIKDNSPYFPGCFATAMNVHYPKKLVHVRLEISADGIREVPVQMWLRASDIEDGVSPADMLLQKLLASNVALL